jgi:hypothetical protein
MDRTLSAWRRALAAAILTLGVTSGAACAHQPYAPPYVKSSLVQRRRLRPGGRTNAAGLSKGWPPLHRRRAGS